MRQDSLSYYASQYLDNTPLGVIDLFADCEHVTLEKKVKTDKHGNIRNAFLLKHPKKEFVIDAMTSAELESWMSSIQNVINQNRQNKNKR